MSDFEKRILLVDGHSLAYRAFYAVPRTEDAQGRAVQVVRGYLSMFLRALAGGFEYAAVAFDPPGLTFREEMMESYKAQRKATPQDVVDQVPVCQEITRAMGLPVLMVPGFEADDVLGTLAVRARSLGLETVILSADKDLLQLVDEHTVLWGPARDSQGRSVVMDVDAVRAKYGFEPIQMIDFKALVGDSSDNLTGVFGIGEKGALALIREYGGLDAMLAGIAEMPPGKARRALEGHEDEARLSRDMVTIVLDVPGVTLDLKLSQVGVYDRDLVASRLSELSLGDLARRLPSPVLSRDVEDPVISELNEMIDALGY